jgi:predicted nucleotide-binding protein
LEEASNELQALLMEANRQRKGGVFPHTPAFWKWRREAESTISRTFGPESSDLIQFRSIPFKADDPEALETIQFHANPWVVHEKQLGQAIALLDSMLHEVRKEIAYKQTESEIQHLSNGSGVEKPLKKISNRIFLVHGRDSGQKETVARLLLEIDLKPIILHEQANEGRTIIEKFEDYSDVGFAVIILTADDFGRLGSNDTTESPRARQNVIFEFGFFIGKLGRRRVCALMSNGIERPSDVDGVVYIPLDKEDWRYKLVRELKSAGYSIDTNRLF